jgi:hypothetical protein
MAAIRHFSSRVSNFAQTPTGNGRWMKNKWRSPTPSHEMSGELSTKPRHPRSGAFIEVSVLSAKSLPKNKRPALRGCGGVPGPRYHFAAGYGDHRGNATALRQCRYNVTLITISSKHGIPLLGASLRHVSP